jgi:glycosyltransferase involved in cell wall biosynthesis
MVSTSTLKAELEARGFTRLVSWRRGIPVQQFASASTTRNAWAKPAFLYVGRVAVEKNLEAFLALDLPGSKVVVGDGPAREFLAAKYSSAIFTGRLDGADLAAAYASADVFVFPSLTDTFGLVMLEALASGVPVAAFPVAGPRDVLGDSGCGVMDIDLRRASMAALDISREKCRAYGARHAMRESARDFVGNIATAIGLNLAPEPFQAAG